VNKFGKAVLFWGAQAEPTYQEASEQYDDSPFALNKIVLNYPVPLLGDLQALHVGFPTDVGGT